ncbi:MAG: hypothetical protein A2039_00145 [Candidatus Melainabacteria bacterium GWA2_34_9]|nr:MAG: hypothetical protein A2039_00145 [Candidatus Melainabacteria bacterium GWA2_34_9]
MSEKEITTITNLQKEILIGNIGDMHARLETIVNETDYLRANFTAMKMVLDNTTEITVKNK